MANSVDPPAKRRKTEDISSDLVEGDDQVISSKVNSRTQQHETVATLPLSVHSKLPGNYIDAPDTGLYTQFLPDFAEDISLSQASPVEDDVIHIPGTSPPPSLRGSSPPTRGFASIIAPAGTVFQSPVANNERPITTSHTHQQHIIELISEDEDAKYLGGSSDEETQSFSANNIPPANFSSPHQELQGQDRFKLITSSTRYDPHNYNPSRITAVPRTSDILASAYGNSVRTGLKANPLATTPPAMKSLENGRTDVDLADIPDFQIRSKVKRMQQILPDISVQDCWQSLIRKKGNFDDAMDSLMDGSRADTALDLTSTPGKKGRVDSIPIPLQKSAKHKIQRPEKKIHERYPLQQSQTQVSRTSVQHSPKNGVPKIRRRLVQGKKKLLGSTEDSSTATIALDDDSEVETAGSDSVQDISSDHHDSRLESQLLGFLNTCSTADLIDVATVNESTADHMLSRRPFSCLDQARQITIDKAGKGSKTSKRNSGQARAIGEKIVEKCLDMWSGYLAIDQLVKQCDKVSQPVRLAMSKWGTDIYGATSQGDEADIANRVDKATGGPRDSGLGSPSSRPISDCDDSELKPRYPKTSRQKDGLYSQPSNMSVSIKLKDYQLVGMNWLMLLFKHKLSCILADDMGLGKTCQVIAFLAQLAENGIRGPHLVIVPGSTLENWLREFENFCPSLSVTPYYAGINERFGIREDIQANIDSINVIVTTYTLAKNKEDNKFLRKLKPVCCIYDEGHMLKNSKSAGYNAYMRIDAQFRLLLTGTPLQNNLTELVSLLGFILPSLFSEHLDDLEAIFNHRAKTSEADESHAVLLSQERIMRAKSMMNPFVLRRRKHQVLKDLPAKHCRVIHCDMTESQREIYNSEKQKAVDIFARRQLGHADSKETGNIMMSLRKAAIHPLLFRQHYDNNKVAKLARACLEEDEFMESQYELVVEDMSVMDDVELHVFCCKYPTCNKYALQNDEWMDSGKVGTLKVLLETMKRNGDRVLIFSQFVLVMNILELVMESLNMQFFRLDGQTKIDERQSMIDEFHHDKSITAFLLSTKAGGAGINLACANKVIIFDSSFNPQDDVQAENRAHRVGQTQEVEVIRLVTKDSIEEQIHALGATKLALDDRIASEESSKLAGPTGEKMVEDMLSESLKGIQPCGDN